MCIRDRSSSDEEGLLGNITPFKPPFPNSTTDKTKCD